MKTRLDNVLRLSALSLLMVLLVNVSSYAQRGNKRGGTPEQKAEKTAKKLTKKLGLTADQTTRVQAASLTMHTAMQTARTNRDRTAAKSARDAYNTEMQGILTSEQYTKFKAMQKNRKRRRRG